MSKEIEEGKKLTLDFNKIGSIAKKDLEVVPVIVQDFQTKEVLILAYANPQALKHSLETRKATFWSTSRNELWIKGETSGDSLEIIDILVNCEQNSLLYLVKCPGGAACHTRDEKDQRRSSCYYRKLKDMNELEFI